MNHFAPLTGIKVLDFSKVLAGPLCTQYLSDMGADVTKIEPCGKGDDTRAWPPFENGEGTVFLSANGNKKSLAIDLKSPEGLDICYQLATQADVVVESFGPGVAKRLGIDFETLKLRNPKLVYCSISGFGTVGPMSQGKGYDVVLQAFSGMISITGEPGRPPVRSPFSPVDQGTGIHAVVGILGGLLERARTGQGVKVEASLFDTSVAFLAYFLQGFWQRGTEPARAGSGHESLCPYQVFDTADKPMILGIANDSLWLKFCKLAGVPELAQRPEYTSNAQRVVHRDQCVAEVAAIMSTRQRDVWLAMLDEADIPSSAVHSLGELSSHPHTAASEMLYEYPGLDGRALKGVSQPLRFDGQRPGARRRPPTLGEHSLDVLAGLDLSPAQIDELIKRGVVQNHKPS
jgi:crotonobetainyl-CoA:carnitine CoA-transferase CaiB-like acyl-CoA transferase